MEAIAGLPAWMVVMGCQALGLVAGQISFTLFEGIERWRRNKN